LIEPQSEVIASYKLVRGHLPTLLAMEQVDVWYEAEMAKAEQKAKQENQQEIALKMLRKNMPLDIIAELTELSIKRLQSLQSQLETH
jgi:hypothetical protein